MSTENSLTNRWQYYADFYRDLIEASGWRQEAMLAFVERITPLAIAGNIWPGTSHQILHLMKRYDWRWRPPVVSLQYGCSCRYRERNTDRCRYKFRCRSGCRRLDYYFLINWRDGSGNMLSTETVEDIDSALWQRIVAWLETQAA